MILICWLKALPFFLRTGVWCPHLYKEAGIKKAMVAVGADYFRETRRLEHMPGERVYTNATIITDRCVCCGKENRTWYAGSVPTI